MKNDFKVIYHGVIEVFGGDFCHLLVVFRKKKRKSPKSYASDPVKAPPKEWLADIKKKRRLCETMIVKTITLQLLH